MKVASESRRRVRPSPAARMQANRGGAPEGGETVCAWLMMIVMVLTHVRRARG